MAILDGALGTLAVLISLLLLTGGVYYNTPALRLELSQIDVFAWVLLALMLLRRQLSGAWLPKRAQTAAAHVLDLLGRDAKSYLAAAIAAYMLFQTWISIWRFDSLHASAFDLGFIDQSLWTTTRFDFLHSSISKGQTYLGEHFSPILVVFAPLYRLTDSVYALFVLQATVLASGATLVYRLARVKGIERGFSVFLAICFLAYHPLRAANTFDFREDDLFVPIFLGALLAAETRRWIVFWLLCVLSWTVKENAPIFTCLIGLWLVLRREKRELGHGLALALLSIPLFLVINTKVTPHFAGSESQTMAVKRLGRFGQSGGEILGYVVRHPFAFASEFLKPFFQVKALKYVVDVCAPFLFFVKASPLMFGIVVLGMIMNVAVNVPTIGFHYECILIPFLFYVLVTGVAKLGARRRTATTATLILMTFLLSFGRSPIDTLRRMKPDAHDRMVAEELKKIPPDASVAAMPVLHPHLTHRRDAYLFSSTAPATDYVVVDLAPKINRYAAINVEADLAAIDGKTYTRIVDRDGLIILKRK